jgi:predicted alpha-1,6-mannanase (GH76 family)
MLGIEIKLKTYDGIADPVEHVEHINAVLQLSVQINPYYVGFYPILNYSSKTESNI